ncbi:MAG: ABC transporter substrate-binding protein [Bdellovibrionaceae bacterium]|nr:ABC transporter substrate-binding protein [Pseudobdellovibrionaceae bacterium]
MSELKHILWACCLVGLVLGCTRSNSEDTVVKTTSVKTWSIYGEIPHMNPFYATDVKVWGLQSLVWDPFIVLNKEGQWEKNIVQSWEFSSDFRVGTFKVVPDLVWSDGTKVTAQDFIFSLSFYQYKELKAVHWQGVFDPIKEVEFENNTLTLSLHRAQGFEVWNQILSMARLLPASVLEEVLVLDSDSSSGSTVNVETLKNTGPYKVQNFSSTKSWRLGKNSKSWWYTSKWSPKDQVFGGKDLPMDIVMQKALSKSVIQRGLEKERFDAFVDYGQLELAPQNYKPLYQQKMAKNLVFNFLDSRLKNYDFRKCLLATLPTPEQLKKLDYKGIEFEWSERQRKLFTAPQEVLKTQSQRIKSQQDQLSAGILQDVATFCLKSNGSAGAQSALNVHYVLDQDRKWLEVWQEKAQKWGVILNLISVGESKMAKLLQEKKYQILISESLLDHTDQWPYEVFFSKGLYNSQSWNDKKLDALLKTKSTVIDFQKKQELNAQISTHILDSLGIIYVYEWVRPLAWVKSHCPDSSHFLWWNLLNCMGENTKTP